MVKKKPIKKPAIKVQKTSRMRKDKKLNMTLIRDAILKYMKEQKKPPTAVELSKQLGISAETIGKHISNMSFDTEKSIWRSLTPDVVASILSSCKKGSSASQKLWMQIFEKFSERQELTGKDGEPLITEVNVTIK